MGTRNSMIALTCMCFWDLLSALSFTKLVKAEEESEVSKLTK